MRCKAKLHCRNREFAYAAEDCSRVLKKPAWPWGGIILALAFTSHHLVSAHIVEHRIHNRKLLSNRARHLSELLGVCITYSEFERDRVHGEMREKGRGSEAPARKREGERVGSHTIFVIHSQVYEGTGFDVALSTRNSSSVRTYLQIGEQNRVLYRSEGFESLFECLGSLFSSKRLQSSAQGT